MRVIPECRQFEIGISTKRYLPAIGTAGFERVAVSGDNRLPWPPPSTMQITLDVMLFELSFRKELYILWPTDPMKSRAPSLIFVSAANAAGWHKVLLRGSPSGKYLPPWPG